MAKFLHFDLTASDTARARKFYESAFGWTFQPMPAPMEYWLIHTGGAKNGIDGGLSARQSGDVSSITFTAVVPDVDARVERVVATGGSVLHEKRRIPGLGDHVSALDPEGLPFGMLQFLPGAEGGMAPDAGNIGNRPVYFEFLADDVTAAMKFYAAVLDWSFENHAGESRYYQVTCGEAEAPGLNGGLMPAVPGSRNVFLAGIETPDVEAAAQAVTVAGGSLSSQRIDIPFVGSVYYCRDTEDNPLAIMEFERYAG